MGVLTRPRPLDEIVAELDASEALSVISCNNCVRAAGSGGEGVWEKVCDDLVARGFRVEQRVLITNPCSRGYLEDLKIPSAVKTVVLLACRGGRASLLSLHPELKVVEGTETLGALISSKADKVLKLSVACPGYEKLLGKDFELGKAAAPYPQERLHLEKGVRS
jgi:hypothetical protein